MAITKYTYRKPVHSGVRDLDAVSNRLARLFDFAPLSTDVVGGSWAPRVDVTETSDELALTAELPGIAEEDITIELANNVLSISGEKTESRTEDDPERRHHVWERSYGSFQRSFRVPSTVSGEDITATYENGILRVSLPKAPEAKGRKIEISNN